MLDIVLNVIEQTQKLVKLKHKQDRSLFEDHVHPIYEKVRLVVDDYLETFALVERHYQDEDELDEDELDRPKPDPNELRDLIDILKERSLKYQGIRTEVAKYATALQSDRGDPVLEFTWSCIRLFRVDPMGLGAFAPLPHTSPMSTLLDTLEDMLTSEDAEDHFSGGLAMRRRFSDGLAKCREHVEESWDTIARAYSELRLACLK